MSRLVFVVLFCLSIVNVYSQGWKYLPDDAKETKVYPHFLSISAGPGVCIKAGSSSMDPGFCYHLGVDYILTKDWSTIGFQFQRINFSVKTKSDTFDKDWNNYYLYYRLPLKHFTVAAGPALFDNGNNYSEAAGAVTLGAATDFEETFSVEGGATFMYNFTNEGFYIYSFANFRLNI